VAELTVLVVEDEKSVLAAALYGYIAIAAPAGAWRQEWGDLLSAVPQVIICADNDAPGERAAYDRQQSIRRARIVTPPSGKDAFDYHLNIMYLAERQQRMREWLGV